MDREREHWKVNVREAIGFLLELRDLVRLEDDLGEVLTIAGIDTAFPKHGGEPVARCAVVVLSFPELHPVEQTTSVVPITFPYVPGAARVSRRARHRGGAGSTRGPARSSPL